MINSFPVENACNTVGCVMISAFDLNDTNDCDIKVNIITFHITTEKINIHIFKLTVKLVFHFNFIVTVHNMHTCRSTHYIFCIQPLYPVNDGFPLKIEKKPDTVIQNNFL